jgi:hypothetical protein
MGEMRNAYKILAKRPEGNLLLGRLKYRWEDNNKFNLYEMLCEGVDCIQLNQHKAQWQAFMNTN